MPVQHAETVLNEHMGQWLSSRVPEDQICTYSVAPVSREVRVCDEQGGGTIFAVVWQVHLFMQPVDKKRREVEKSINFNAVVPYEHLNDGDTEHLEKAVLEPMWADITFSQMMDSVDDEIEQSAQEPEE